MHTNGGTFSRSFESFGVVAGTVPAMERMTAGLRERASRDASFEETLRLALEAWAVGHLALETDENSILAPDQIRAHALEQMGNAAVEAARLDRTSTGPVTWRALPDAEVRRVLEER
jgi:hypothetical protein